MASREPERLREPPPFTGTARPARKSLAVGGGSSPARATACQPRSRGTPEQHHCSSPPRSSSRITASREMRVTPSPARTDSRMAPLDPSVRVDGEMPSSSNSSSVVERVPEPGSRAQQPHLGGQLLDADLAATVARRGRARRRTTRRGPARRGHHHQAVGPGGQAGEATVARWPPGDDQVDLPEAEQLPHPAAVAHLEGHLGLRATSAEGRQVRRQHVLAGRGHRGQAHPPPLGVELAGRCTPGLLQQAEHLAGVTGEDLTGRSELEAPAVAGHEGNPEIALEGGDGGRDRRLAHHEARQPHAPSRWRPLRQRNGAG